MYCLITDTDKYCAYPVMSKKKKERDTVFQVLYKHFIGMSISMLCEPEVSFVTVRADAP